MKSPPPPLLLVHPSSGREVGGLSQKNLAPLGNLPLRAALGPVAVREGRIIPEKDDESALIAGSIRSHLWN